MWRNKNVTLGTKRLSKEMVEVENTNVNQYHELLLEELKTNVLFDIQQIGTNDTQLKCNKMQQRRNHVCHT